MSQQQQCKHDDLVWQWLQHFRLLWRHIFGCHCASLITFLVLLSKSAACISLMFDKTVAQISTVIISSVVMSALKLLAISYKRLLCFLCNLMLNVCLVQDLIWLWDLMSGYLQRELHPSFKSFIYHAMLTYKGRLPLRTIPFLFNFFVPFIKKKKKLLVFALPFNSLGSFLNPYFWNKSCFFQWRQH